MGGLWQGERARIGPFYAALDVTGRCNLRCVGCRFHQETEWTGISQQDPPDIPLDLARRFFEQLPRPTCQEVELLGSGEPLLHPQIMEIIAAAKERGLHVKLFTNGTLLDEAKAQQLISLGLDYLHVTLWANTPEEYTQTNPGSPAAYFAQTLRGLECVARAKARLNRRKPVLALHQPITSVTRAGLFQRIDLARRAGGQRLTFSPFHSWEQFAHLNLSPAQLKELLAQAGLAQQAMARAGLEHNLDHMRLRFRLGVQSWHWLPCYNPWLHLRLMRNGDLVFCDIWPAPIGNLRQQSLAEIWNSPTSQDIRRRTARPGQQGGLGQPHNCDYCCFASDHLRVHRLWRWLAPLAAGARRLRPGGRHA